MKNNDAYYRAIGVIDRIEEVREERGISKPQVGLRLGLTKEYYYSFYNIARAIQVDTLLKIAKVLDVNVEYLLEGRYKSNYKDNNYGLERIINCKCKLNGSLATIRCKLRKGVTKSITIKTLLEFEEVSKIPAIELIKNPA
jgi:DNA-binding Xre family transcriptional regulator